MEARAGSLSEDFKPNASQHSMQIVSSTAPASQAPPGYAFRGRRYAQVLLKLGSPQNEAKTVCVDTGCGMSLIDRKFLKEFAPTASISIMPTPMTVRGIGDKQHNANQFATLDFYLPTASHLVAHFKREIHIVDELDANALLGLDIAGPEGWNIDLDAEVLTLPHCSGVKIPLTTQVKGPKTETPVFAAERVKLPPHCRRIIKFSDRKGNQLQWPARDLLYEPVQQELYTSFAHIIDSSCTSVLVENNSDTELTIL